MREDGNNRVAILGAGNMGGALLGGMLKSGFVKPDQVVATTKGEDHARALRERYGCTVTAGGNREAVQGADLIVLATKPHVVPLVVEEIRDVLTPDQQAKWDEGMKSCETKSDS